MTPPRKLRLTRSSVNRDPMLRGVWVGGLGDLPAFPSSIEPDMPPPPPPPPPPDLPVVDPELARKWQSLIDIADAVFAELGENVDRTALLRLVDDLVHCHVSAADVAALYRHRVSHG